jgi:hypothetical protein
LIATASPGSVAAMGSPYGCFCDASRKISPTAAAPSESRSTTRQRREFGHRELRNKFRFWEFGYVCNAKVNPASKTARQLLCEPVESFSDQISHLPALSVQRRELDRSARRAPRFREKEATDRDDSCCLGRGQATSCVSETPLTRRTQRNK